MNLFELLEKKQKYRRPFSSGEEFRYFIERRHLLGAFKRFAHLYDSEENEFDIIRANILLQGLENKKTFEEEIININNHGRFEHAQFVEALKERTIDKPYYEENDIKIYMPFFSSALNEIYVNEPERLLSLPYSDLMTNFENATVDPFDTYGAELYNSYFTSLIKISTNGRTTTFFHYDTNTLYFVNDQGRLDIKLVLFDKYIKKPVTSHMIERLVPVTEAYYANDKLRMLIALRDNKFISMQMFKILTERK